MVLAHITDATLVLYGLSVIDFCALAAWRRAFPPNQLPRLTLGQDLALEEALKLRHRLRFIHRVQLPALHLGLQVNLILVVGPSAKLLNLVLPRTLKLVREKP